MADNPVQVNFRMPSDLKERLESAARMNGRSLTAEITYRLEASLAERPPMTLADLAKYVAPPQPPDDPLDDLRREIQELSKQIDEFRKEGFDIGKSNKR